MNSNGQIMPKDVDFFYVLGEHGWSSCYLHINEILYHMNITHVFNDPIADLLEALMLMLKGEKETTIKWYDEPGEYIWTIKRNERQNHIVQITITNCSILGYNVISNIQNIEFETKLKLFCMSVFCQMEKIQFFMTEKSYKKNRKCEFPYDVYHEFKGLLKVVYSL